MTRALRELNYGLCFIEKEFFYQVVNLYPNTVVVEMQILQQDLIYIVIDIHPFLYNSSCCSGFFIVLNESHVVF